MAEWISEFPEPVAPEHIRRGHITRGAGVDRLLVRRVHIRDVQEHAAGRAAKRLWRSIAATRHLVREHQHGVADLEFRVAYLAGRAIHPHDLVGSEGVFVEVDCAGAVVHSQVWSCGVISAGYWIHFIWHKLLLRLRL